MVETYNEFKAVGKSKFDKPITRDEINGLEPGIYLLDPREECTISRQEDILESLSGKMKTVSFTGRILVRISSGEDVADGCLESWKRKDGRAVMLIEELLEQSGFHEWGPDRVFMRGVYSQS
jgi:hypothetical protein